ncbi:response regulator transcription factor [Salipaludibacillus agaradhaerens]|uniref:response regulator transcription factor n=1 Tax=Salipaludibacillus agaradhaerens TaxID=76935 RepID=UPI00215151B5|nr:response regulator transcription factor [Salipaludibacillus agaradhaerens]MCR6108479.1 response regulator transcription factor [Salipaludibacillus agaradhaerens]MCR6120500.1 response regulator transcription factor [Salipaludibacillus agaradhaerens]UJW59510.1 response regulator transcription factor [Bacillus sp. A116_S68]
MSTLLIIDDDPHIRELVKLALRADGYDLMEAGSGTEALTILKRTPIDGAIVDIMLPGVDGLHVCREIKHYYEIPVLLLTAKGTNNDKVKGFQSGTDDYLVKPFDPLELSYRIKALLRRFRMDKGYSVHLGDFYMNTERVVRVNDISITLPPKEFDLLFKLASHPNRGLTREQLIEHVWGVDFEGDERTVDVHVKRLRERFSQLTDSFEIVTVRGLGYRLETKHV